MKISRKDKFESMIQSITESGCWIWMGASFHGYGTFNYEGKLQRAHRVAWQMFRGPIPDDLNVLHKCDVKCCVNPNHLYLGTNKENVRDAFQRGQRPTGDRHWRRLNPERQRGEEGPNAKLTEDRVREMLRSQRTDYAEMGREYGVSSMHVSRIMKRQVWRHVEY